MSLPVDSDNSSPRDPDALCHRCGNRGTAVRVTRHLVIPDVRRFCSNCWKDVRLTLDDDAMPPGPGASMEEIDGFVFREPEPGLSVESRSWDEVLAFLELVRSGESRDLKSSAEAKASYRKEVALEIVLVAPDMDGPMPPEVERFVRQNT